MLEKGQNEMTMFKITTEKMNEVQMDAEVSVTCSQGYSIIFSASHPSIPKVYPHGGYGVLELIPTDIG